MNRKENDDGPVTPPWNDEEFSLLTPPPTDKKAAPAVRCVLNVITAYQNGRRDISRSWLGFRIDAVHYHELEQQLSEDQFCRNKLRRGYFPLQRLFIIRMPSHVHERFLVRLHDDIRRQLRSVAEGPSEEFANNIQFEGSTTYTPSDPEYGRHDPDGSFRHVRERFPGLVTEAAYSQEGQMLGDLADDYILGSDLRVRALAAFDISYKKKVATVSVWRPRLRQEVEGDVWMTASDVQIFRGEDGEPNLDPNAGLRLHLRDFANIEFYEQCGNIQGTIFISCESLYTYLNEAESVGDFEAGAATRPPLRKRRRTPSPEETMGTDDEGKMCDAGERAAKRVNQDDSSFKDSSSGTNENG